MSETGKDKQDDCQSSFEAEHLQGYMERVADTLKISNPKYTIGLASKKGDNYVAIVYRVSIEGDNEGVPARIETVLKVAPTDENLREIVSVRHFFPREHVFYTEIVPVFEKILHTKNKHLENIPKCYFSSDVDHKEATCLENLRSKGFVMRDRMKQLDFPHASLAFRALGRLHALSFALRDQRPEVFASKIAGLKETMFRPDTLADETFASQFDGLRQLVEVVLAEEDPKYLKRFSEFSVDILSRVAHSCDGSVAEPYAVLCHGDFWTNNMLFKYEKDSEEPKDIYLLDFQLSRFASAATDISYNLYCSCSQELRAKHFDELIRIYHDSLSAYLLELGSDPKKLFPFEALVEQLNKFSTYGAGMAIMALFSFTSEEGDVMDLNHYYEVVPQLQERIHRDHFWKNSLRDAFKDLIDRNYI